MTIKYTKDHEWIRLENEGAVEGVIGITVYAQEQLGDLVYIELPEIGRHVKQGDEACVVESAKAASEVYAPVDGEILAVNDGLGDEPGLVNDAPMDGGWIMKVKLANKDQLSSLMDESEYQSYIQGL